ncbi:unnamed protein product [Cunninghamella blakesleeana]
MTSSDRVFIIGGTGNVGTKAVKDLLNKKIPVTLYARNPKKVTDLFPDHINDTALLSIIQGDLNDLTPLKDALAGHTRLFLLVNISFDLPSVKGEIAKLAYDSGIKQIVDISSITVSYPWRTTAIGYQHFVAEKRILDIAEQSPKTRYFVTLRPGRFMSNTINFDRPTDKGITDSVAADAKQGWISPNDIGSVAAVVLSEDIEKHGNAVYELVGEVITPTRRAEILSHVLDRNYTYQSVTAVEKFNQLKAIPYFSFQVLYNLSAIVETDAAITPGISILLGRDPETYEQFITKNKNALL